MTANEDRWLIITLINRTTKANVKRNAFPVWIVLILLLTQNSFGENGGDNEVDDDQDGGRDDNDDYDYDDANDDDDHTLIRCKNYRFSFLIFFFDRLNSWV